MRGQRRFSGFCCLFFLATMFALFHTGKFADEKFSTPVSVFIDFLGIVAAVIVSLEIFVIRMVSDANGIQYFDMLNRKRAELKYEEITSYAKDNPGGWVIHGAGQSVRLGKIDKQQFHSVIAEKAPWALNAKLWVCGQLPPSEDFTGLSVFDLNMWLTTILGAGVMSAMIGLISRGYALGYLISSAFQSSYHLKDVVGTLDLTEEGISVAWPWDKRKILWTELTAVFCERTSDRFSYFVLTAPERAITIPSHILANPEVRRKFFYSIPDQTKCVNFDKLKFRRRGRGKKIMSEESYGVFEPTMGV